MQVPDHAYIVILAGGGGTRLWPKSRQKHPKHLLSLLGPDSMLQLTFQRVLKIVPAEKILIITRTDHLEEAQTQLPEIPAENWIVEPEAKNTAMAMGVAAQFVAHKEPEAVMINLPADQMILEEKPFANAIIGALQMAQQREDIVVVGIRPKFPHTGLGYIKTGEQVDVAEDKRTYVFGCKGFKEKPDLATAQSFLASGQYLWNAGWFAWSVKTVNQAFSDHAPEISAALEKISEAIGTKDQDLVMAEVYKQAESVQIDVAIAEKAKNLIVIPGEFTWSDIGDWKAIYDAADKDGRGNAVFSEGENHIELDNRNCLIETNGRMVVTIGLEDVVVIDTEDAVLVCAKDRTQDIKKIVEKLKESEKSEYL